MILIDFDFLETLNRRMATESVHSRDLFMRNVFTTDRYISAVTGFQVVNKPLYYHVLENMEFNYPDEFMRILALLPLMQLKENEHYKIPVKKLNNLPRVKTKSWLINFTYEAVMPAQYQLTDYLDLKIVDTSDWSLNPMIPIQRDVQIRVDTLNLLSLMLVPFNFIIPKNGLITFVPLLDTFYTCFSIRRANEEISNSY